jgi:type VI protein secretion system component VasK
MFREFPAALALAQWLLGQGCASTLGWGIKKETHMNLTRSIFLALAVLVPTSWTIAKAEDAPATDAPKKEKKSKKSKKAEGEKKEEKKAE